MTISNATRREAVELSIVEGVDLYVEFDRLTSYIHTDRRFDVEPEDGIDEDRVEQITVAWIPGPARSLDACPRAWREPIEKAIEDHLQRVEPTPPEPHEPDWDAIADRRREDREFEFERECRAEQRRELELE